MFFHICTLNQKKKQIVLFCQTTMSLKLKLSSNCNQSSTSLGAFSEQPKGSKARLKRVQKALNQGTNHRFTLCSAIYSGLCCSFYPFDTIWVLFDCQFLCIFYSTLAPAEAYSPSLSNTKETIERTEFWFWHSQISCKV